MNVLQSLKSFVLYGQGGYRTGRQWGSWWLPGTQFDYSKQVGDQHLNAVVSMGVNWITRNLLESCPIMEEKTTAKDGTPTYKMTDDPLIQILEDANPWYDWSRLIMGTVLSLISEGDAYWFPLWGAAVSTDLRQPAPKGLRPTGFLYVPHFQMQPVSDPAVKTEAMISYYDFTPLGGGDIIRVDPSRVVHYSWGIDPRNPIRGFGPLRALLREIYSDNLASSYSAALLRNCGVPGLGFTPKDNKQMAGVTPEYVQAFGDSLKKTLSPDGAGTALLSVLPWDIKQLGFSPEQLGLKSLRDVPVSRICGAIGLDQMVLSLDSSSKTYSNYAVAERKSFYGGVMPLQTIIARQFTRQVMRRYLNQDNRRLGWDHSTVKALQEDENKLWDRTVTAAREGVITRKQAKILLRQEVDDARDDIYLTDGRDKQQIENDAREAGLRALARRKLLEDQPEEDDE